MGTVFISNAFSINMVKSPANLTIAEVDINDVKNIVTTNSFTSAIGHNSTSEILSKLLGVEVPTNRISISLNNDDILIVFQVMVRIEEGRILSEEELQALPKKFFLVKVI